MDIYKFELSGRVTDAEALHEAAAAHPDAEYCELRDTDGEIDVAACLQVLLDPSTLPGFEIDGSDAEYLTTAVVE